MMYPLIVKKSVSTVLFVTLVCSSAVLAKAKNVSEEWATKNDFGGAGIFQMRTARSVPDGTFEFGYSSVDQYKRYYLTVQALPWLEGTFRYTEIRNRLFSAGGLQSGNQSFKDRGADITLRLLEESKYLPAISFTLQDGLGTGVFSGEYLAVSKTFYDLYLTGGLAWGYAASGATMKNPLINLDPIFADRGGGGGFGGTLQVNSYMSGAFVAPYVGAEYRTPVEGLFLKFEYDPNDYQSETLKNQFSKSSDFNYGLVYRPFPWLETSLSRQRGNITSFRVSLLADLHNKGMPKFDPLPQAILPRDVVDRTINKQISIASSKDEDAAIVVAQGSELIGETQIANIDHPDDETKNSLYPSVDESELRDLAKEFLIHGVELVQIDVLGDVVSINVREHVSNVEETEVYERLALSVLDHILIDVTKFSFRRMTSSNASLPTVSFPRSEIEETAILDHLFKGMEALGVAMADVSLTDNMAEFVIESSDGHQITEAELFKISGLVFDTMPMALEMISLVSPSAHIGRTAFKFSRAEVEQNSLVSELFDGLENIGIAVESIDDIDGKTTLSVSGSASGNSVDFAMAADFVSDVMDVPLNKIAFEEAQTRTSIDWKTNNRFAFANKAGKAEVRGANSGNNETQEFYSGEEMRIISNRLFSALNESKFYADGLVFGNRKITVYGTANYYPQQARMTGRTARIIANNIPSEIEEISVVSLSGGMEMSKITLLRSDLENAVNDEGSPEEIWARGKIEPGKPGILLPDNAIYNWRRYPRVQFSVAPRLRSHVGGPDQFILYQLWGAISGNISFWRGLELSALVGVDFYNNFDKISLASDSVLPHVRSDIKDYLQQGATNLIRLQLNYMFSPMREFYARGSWGIFEEMYGGYGGELLYRPIHSRLAIGLEWYKAKKRDFDQRFTYQDYKIVTSHLSAYYEWPKYDLVSIASFGQYLAGDIGSTFSVSRQFKGGVSIGMWATFTDVSAEDFGEGSFDKGFSVTVPFDLFFSKTSTKTGSFAFRPLTRDGGQKIGIGPRLYDVTGASSNRAIMHDWDRFLD
jgi:hypothetical protein